MDRTLLPLEHIPVLQRFRDGTRNFADGTHNFPNGTLFYQKGPIFARWDSIWPRGLMFAGAYLGQAVGGAGVLFLLAYFSFPMTYFFVAACVLSITVFIAVPLQEPKSERSRSDGRALSAAVTDIKPFIVDAFRAFTGSRERSSGSCLQCCQPERMRWVWRSIKSRGRTRYV